MRTIWIALVLLVGSTSALAGGGGKMPFVTPEKGFSEAKRSGKPIFMYFTADW